MVANQNTQLARAYRLYVRFQTTSDQYREIAAGMGLSVLELNKRIHAIYVERKLRD